MNNSRFLSVLGLILLAQVWSFIVSLCLLGMGVTGADSKGIILGMCIAAFSYIVGAISSYIINKLDNA